MVKGDEMKNNSVVRRSVQLVIATAAMWLGAIGAVAAQVPTVTVAVFSDHYVLGRRYIDDLDRLEDAIAEMRPRGVRLDACGESASRALRAATHRFRNLYLDLRTAGIDDAACQSASVARA